MKPFSRTAILATAIATVLTKLGMGPWYTFMISAIFFVGAVRLTGFLPGHFPSITTCIGVVVTIGLMKLGVGAAYSFIAGGIMAFPLIIYLLYKYLASEEPFPAD